MPKPEAVNWGILGPGRIAHRFAEGLSHAAGARLAAVGSRSAERAAQFAAQYGGEPGTARAHAGYEALAADPGVDAVYVATPHPQHAAACLLCLEAGKHVLCEKPLTVNAAEARAVADCARDRGLLLVEGMWTRFIPATVALRELIAGGEIGEPHVVHADIGFASTPDPASRLYAPALAGGALLDIGVYGVSFASMLLGSPASVSASAHIGTTGVDERTAVSLSYPGGAVAALTCSITTSSPHLAYVTGSDGYVTVGPPFWLGDRLTVHRGDAAPDERSYPIAGNGFNYEAEHFMELIRAGATESPVMPLAESIAISETLDAVRRAIGVSYPFEAKE
jgi:predicted dehydrogenase